MIYLSVQEHVEGDLIPWLETIPLDIACIENGAQNVLYTGRHFINAFRGNGCIRSLNESYILVCLIPALINIPYKFVRLKCPRINISLISVPYPIKFVIKAIGLPIPYHMIDSFIIHVLQRIGKNSLSCSHIYIRQLVKYFIGQRFPGHESSIASPAKFIAEFITSLQGQR